MFTIMTPVWDNVMSDWKVSNYFFFIYSSTHVYVYKSQTLSMHKCKWFIFKHGGQRRIEGDKRINQ